MKNQKNRTKSWPAMAMQLILCLVMVMAFSSGCGKTGNTDSSKTIAAADSTEKTGNQPADSKNAKLMEKLENPNVSMLHFGDWLDPKLKDYFAETCGGKLNVTLVPWEMVESKAIASAAAGTPFDLVYFTKAQFPKYAIKNILQPIDQYFDLEDPLLDQSNGSKQYTWKGKRYCIGDPMATYVFYNKTMFEDNGLETPLELYNKGEWNLENFQKAAIALTQDTDGDGKVDQWGAVTWLFGCFAAADGGKLVTYDQENGAITLTMDDPKVKYGLKFLQDGLFKYKYFGGGMENATAAMGIFEAYYVGVMYQSIKPAYEWDFVPFPIGPDNADKLIPGNSSPLGICNGAKNPYGAAAFLYAVTKFNYDHKNDINPKNPDLRTEEQKKRMEDCNSRIVLDMSEGVGNMGGLMGQFYGDIGSTTPLATTLAKYTPIFQNEINTCMNDTRSVKSTPFEPVPVMDFEDGKLDAINYEGLTGIDSLKITTDSNEVLDGNASLKIATTKGSESQLFFNTLPDKVALPAYHIYKITFDYKVLADIPDDGYYFVTIRPKDNVADGKVSFGWITFNGKKAGETGEFEGLIAVNNDAANCCIVMGGSKTGDIVVDNLNVTEQ